MTSTTGTTWTSRQSPADNNWQSVAFGNGLFVAVADNDNDDNDMLATCSLPKQTFRPRSRPRPKKCKIPSATSSQASVWFIRSIPSFLCWCCSTIWIDAPLGSTP